MKKFLTVLGWSVIAAAPVWMFFGNGIAVLVYAFATAGLGCALLDGADNISEEDAK